MYKTTTPPQHHYIKPPPPLHHHYHTTTTTTTNKHHNHHHHHNNNNKHLSPVDRGPLEDENDNLVNEAREREKAFIDTTQNEQYLTEDSTGLDPPPPLPLYGAGGAVRRVRVGGDDGPPMVYSVRLHAEQVRERD